MNKNKDKVKYANAFGMSFRTIVVIFIVLICVVLSFPYFFVEYSWFNLDFRNTGQIGDTIGGITGPFIAIIASFLTFIAFWVQYQANEQQKRDLQIERFESKFYTMLEIHRQNVNEISINEAVNGRLAFSQLFLELSSLYFVIKKKLDKKYSDDLIYNISYLFFFFGKGFDSLIMIKSFFSSEYHEELTELGKYLDSILIEDDVEKNKFTFTYFQNNYQILAKTKHKPFQGHSENLSHYVRHLYQLIALIHNQPDDIFSYEVKYSYVAVVRAQLSISEQLLLYYNSLSVLGEPWNEDGKDFIREYCLVKSMPTSLAYFYKDPHDFLGTKNKHGKLMFEWTRINERIVDMTSK